MRHKSNFASGQHIIAARTLLGISQAQLAALSGIHRNSLQRWESMTAFDGGWALEKIEIALLLQGVIVKRHPLPSIAMTIGA
jgi:transcriptional regulator with XRE-family HTH domain